MSESNNSILERMEVILKFASESVAQNSDWAEKVKENWDKTLKYKLSDPMNMSN